MVCVVYLLHFNALILFEEGKNIYVFLFGHFIIKLLIIIFDM